MELLVVVAILSSLSLLAATFVENQDDQARFEETRRRLEMIRRAVVSDRTVDGRPEIRGFVADVGELPSCLESLMTRQPDCDDDGSPDPNPPAAWAFDINAEIWAGWNGPYLAVQPSLGGTVQFLDGWGNDWRFEVKDADADGNDELVVQSYGKDGPIPQNTGDPYEADYPVGADPILVDDPDWQVEVTDSSGNGGIPVTLVTDFAGSCSNPGYTTKASCENNGGTWTFATYDLCLQVYYRKNGAVATENGTKVTVSRDGTTQTVTFPFNANFRLPTGRNSAQVHDWNATGNDCSGPVRPGGADPVLFTVSPRAAIGPIPWSLR